MQLLHIFWKLKHSIKNWEKKIEAFKQLTTVLSSYVHRKVKENEYVMEARYLLNSSLHVKSFLVNLLMLLIAHFNTFESCFAGEMFKIVFQIS